MVSKRTAHLIHEICAQSILRNFNQNAENPLQNQLTMKSVTTVTTEKSVLPRNRYQINLGNGHFSC